MTSINSINYLNVGSAFTLGLFTLNLDLPPGLELLNMFNLLDFPLNYEQGAMTPAEPFFLFFNVVSLLLWIFAFAQLLPKYRASPMVQEGVGYWFAITTASQVLAYAFSAVEQNLFSISMSTLFFGISVGCAWKILHNQAQLESDGSSEEYWMLRFPFSVQAGWSFVPCILSANALFAMGGQVMKAIIIVISIKVYALIPVKLLLFNETSPNYVIPAFFSLITFGIGINTEADPNAGLTSIAFMGTIYLISFVTAVSTGYLVYVNEIVEAEETDEFVDDAYAGAEMTNTNASAIA